jgi:hypothetical protein
MGHQLVSVGWDGPVICVWLVFRGKMTGFDHDTKIEGTAQQHRLGHDFN